MPRSKATAWRWSRPTSASTSSRSAARRRATSSRPPSISPRTRSRPISAACTRKLPADRQLVEPAQLVAEARQILREKFLAADVGITGANFLIAETGSSVIVTNEGNGDLTQSLPKVHIVLASIEKMVPTLEDVGTLIRLLARSATGQEISTYTTFSTGPRRAGDPDGPEACHVVILDNGRSELLGTAFARGAALHPLRRLHEPLPGLYGDRRPCLRLGLSGPDRLGADAGADRRARRPGTCPTPPPSAGAARRCAR